MINVFAHRQEFLVSRVIGNEMDEAEDTFDKVGDSTNIVISVTDNDWIYPEPEEVDEDENRDDEEEDMEGAMSEGIEMTSGSPSAADPDSNRKN